jgi:2',3'-cyclic-nucleotide 2'-phosphodiesterase (5'-nucleotidase family)
MPDTSAAALIEGFRVSAESGLDQVITEALEEIPRGSAEHPLGRLIADAMLASSGADVALMNRGGVRAAIPRGPVTPRIVYEAIPFEEDLFVITLTGADLRRILETGMQGRRRDMEPSGFTAVRNQALPDGAKIESLLFFCNAAATTEIYTLVTTGYLAQGNVGYDLMREFEAVPTGVTLLDAVVGYLSGIDLLSSDDMPRVTWIDEPR